MAWKLTHPDSDQVVEVDADSVAVYLSQGWQTQSGRTPATAGDAPLPSVSVDITPLPDESAKKK
jgi:hypothetical protein